MDRLDEDNGGVRASPLGKSGVRTGWDIPKRDTGNNPKEVVAHSLEIRLEFALNVNNESGCDRGDQTGLFAQKNKSTLRSRWMRKRTLTKTIMVFKSLSYFSAKSRSCSSALR
jgi:hypothetical protein